MCITSLSTLLQGIAPVPSVFDVTIHGLKTDSRDVRSGDAFVALAGARTPADHYIEQAIGAGATVILLESAQPDECYEHEGVLIVPVTMLRAHLGKLADRFFEHPSQRLRLIGVTGTNGKTSVSHYIATLLQETGTPCGVIGTLGYGMPGALQEGTHTTPDVVQVNRVLSKIIAQGGRAAAMEVSSHALEQGRVDNLTMTGAVFTNLTRDHLDYHGSMDAYGAAKARLFHREELHFAVINFDDPFGRQLYEKLDGKCDRVRYSLHEAQTELWLTEFAPSIDGFSASVDGLWGRFDVSARVLGSFALNSALAALRPHVGGRLFCVFGCGGDRDTGKRPEMAREAEKGADVVIVTDDNPRSEDPDAITADIVAGFERPEQVAVIHDRAEAIRQAIHSAVAGDIVLIAGKGHEAWQEVAGQRFPFSDAEQVRHALSLNGGVA